MADNTIFDDIMLGRQEIDEYQKGNLHLNSRTIIKQDDGVDTLYIDSLLEA